MLVTRVGDRVKAGDHRRCGCTLPSPPSGRQRNWTELEPLCWAIAGATLKFHHNESCAEDYKAVIRRAFI
jgi:hypothetical protein